ncbi:sodium/potassium/calcium exchanger 1-like [Hetaerina americana]|uniref:sodium/potassium/calcium exchanger 1-like n=1 Tax=Hetaerina americana TaxID=62018 RepID=UPI003A7F25CA
MDSSPPSVPLAHGVEGGGEPAGTNDASESGATALGGAESEKPKDLSSRADEEPSAVEGEADGAGIEMESRRTPTEDDEDSRARAYEGEELAIEERKTRGILEDEADREVEGVAEGLQSSSEDMGSQGEDAPEEGGKEGGEEGEEGVAGKARGEITLAGAEELLVEWTDSRRGSDRTATDDGSPEGEAGEGKEEEGEESEEERGEAGAESEGEGEEWGEEEASGEEDIGTRDEASGGEEGEGSAGASGEGSDHSGSSALAEERVFSFDLEGYFPLDLTSEESEGDKLNEIQRDIEAVRSVCGRLKADIRRERRKGEEWGRLLKGPMVQMGPLSWRKLEGRHRIRVSAQALVLANGKVDQSPIPLEYRWREDPQLLSAYSSHKVRRRMDIRAYAVNHEEIIDIISDFLLFVLINKPKDVVEYTKEYFTDFK